MLFNSVTFLFLFLPIALLVYYIVPKRYKNLTLLCASLFFYAWGSLIYVFLLAGSVFVNYLFGRGIRRDLRDDFVPTGMLALAIVFNLGLLGVFRYVGSVANLLGAEGTAAEAFRNLAVPIGISFYTLRTVSYLIDIYRGEAKPEKNMINFALCIAMFPQMFAGPVLSYREMERQLRGRKFTWDGFGRGAYRFLIGLAKKTILADGIGTLFAAVNSQVSSGLAVPAEAWIGAAAFMLQIYFDFSGYTDMASGLAGMFGFRFPKNFNYPYTAVSIREFLRRWNISVTRWFEDYVYRPLSAGRMTVPRNILNLLIVWALVGFWYGASWSFVIWGLFLALILIMEKYVWGKALAGLPVIVRHLYSLAILLVSWVFFFGGTMRNAVHYLGTMFGAADFGGSVRSVFYLLSSNWLLLVVGILCCTAIPAKIMSLLGCGGKRRTAYIVVMLLLLLLSVACLVSGTFEPYRYYGS